MKSVTGEGAMQKLFVVTTDKSLYLVTVPIGSTQPIVDKISGGNGAIPHQGNNLVAVLKSGIQFYCGNVVDGVPQRLDEVTPQLWGEKTSGVVALFWNEEEAIQCLAVLQTLRRYYPYDPLWKEQTFSVVENIRMGHPTFTISDIPGYAFY